MSQNNKIFTIRTEPVSNVIAKLNKKILQLQFEKIDREIMDYVKPEAKATK